MTEVPRPTAADILQGYSDDEQSSSRFLADEIGHRHRDATQCFKEQFSMRWIGDEEIFEEILSLANDCGKIDEQRGGGNVVRLVFDPSELCTKPFLGLLNNLMGLGGDHSCYFLVVDPDPRNYFHLNFQRFPLTEISKGEVVGDYLSALNEDPGASPADAIGTNWEEYFIVPQSKNWFVRGRRDESVGGHLCIPADWSKRITELYPYARLM